MQGALCRVSYFEERFLSQKSDASTGKRGCETAKHFWEYCTSENSLISIRFKFIESVNNFDKLLKRKLWSDAKYWQAQLSTLNHSLNSPSNLYCINRKATQFRKERFHYTPNDLVIPCLPKILTFAAVLHIYLCNQSTRKQT